jgi:hypothetical protein
VCSGRGEPTQGFPDTAKAEPSVAPPYLYSPPQAVDSPTFRGEVPEVNVLPSACSTWCATAPARKGSDPAPPPFPFPV